MSSQKIEEKKKREESDRKEDREGKILGIRLGYWLSLNLLHNVLTKLNKDERGHQRASLTLLELASRRVG